MFHIRATRPRKLVAAIVATCLSFAALVALAALPGAGASARAGTAETASAAKNGGAKPTVVLVHGAWADGSSWSGVVRELQDDGYPVVAPPNPLRGLTGDSSYIADFLKTISGPIVLVGHSYGGAVITNAATGNPNVKALVYVDAFIPDQGENVLQLAGERPGSCLGGGGDPTKVFNLVPFPGAQSGDFDLYLKSAPNAPYPGFAACFANDLSASQAALLAAVQRPLTLFGAGEASGAPAWKTLPSWAVIGTDDRVIPPTELQFMAERAGSHIVSVRASHLSLISQPDVVSKTIIAAARATN